MANMSEDALFKALLKNKPGSQPAQQEQTAPKQEVPVKREPVRSSSGAGSEDAMYKALLRNKPPQQQYSQPAKPIPPKPVVTAPVREEIRPVVQAAPVETHQPQRTVISDDARQTERVVESINKLTTSVNQIHTMLKNVIVPILILVVVVGVGIAILVSK
jgi:hypothetical protein